ncbi:helix-hairpin-helix domain-containing protein, partial [Streptococcus pyogenes]
VGSKASKILVTKFGHLEALAQAQVEDIAEIEGLGQVIAQSLVSYFTSQGAKELLVELKEAGVNLAYKGQVAVTDGLLS